MPRHRRDDPQREPDSGGDPAVDGRGSLLDLGSIPKAPIALPPELIVELVTKLHDLKQVREQLRELIADRTEERRNSFEQVHLALQETNSELATTMERVSRLEAEDGLRKQAEELHRLPARVKSLEGYSKAFDVVRVLFWGAVAVGTFFLGWFKLPTTPSK